MSDEHPVFARSTNSNPTGKSTTEAKTHLSEEDRDRLSALAVLHGQTVSEYLRDLIHDHLYGTIWRIRLIQNRQQGRAGMGQGENHG